MFASSWSSFVARYWACLCGLSLGWLLWLSPAHAAEPDEARLSAIRQAMVEAALNGPTRVQATSWMDSNGALREFNRFSSEVRLREIRMQEASTGVPVRDARPVAKHVEPVMPESCIKPAAKGTLRQVLQSVVSVSPNLNPAERYLAQQVGLTAMSAMTARGARSNYWRLTKEASTARVYDRQYMGRGQEHLQWQLELIVESAHIIEVAQETPALSLRWVVRPHAQEHAWFERADYVPPRRAIVNAATPRIDKDMAQAIERSVAAFSVAMDERFACEPQAMALQTEDGQLVVRAGDMSGLRVGDRVLLTDPRHLPEHALEPQALDAAVLAEVKSVSAYRSELKLVTSRKLKPNTAWVAWPYTY